MSTDPEKNTNRHDKGVTWFCALCRQSDTTLSLQKQQIIPVAGSSSRGQRCIVTHLMTQIRQTQHE